MPLNDGHGEHQTPRNTGNHLPHRARAASCVARGRRGAELPASELRCDVPGARVPPLSEPTTRHPTDLDVLFSYRAAACHWLRVPGVLGLWVAGTPERFVGLLLHTAACAPRLHLTVAGALLVWTNSSQLH